MTGDDLRNKLQIIVSELQNCVQQIAAVQGQLKELEATLELLGTQDGGSCCLSTVRPAIIGSIR